MANTAAPDDWPRSTFVTRIGRAFLMGSLVLITITLTQLSLLFAPPASFIETDSTNQTISWSLLLGSCALYTATLVVSWSLLKRRSWARSAFVGLMAFGIALNVAKLGARVLIPAPRPAMEGPAPYLFILRFASLTDVLFPFGVIALFAWIIVRLQSSPVRAEFGERSLQR
jgi:hypothetical protein